MFLEIVKNFLIKDLELENKSFKIFLIYILNLVSVGNCVGKI